MFHPPLRHPVSFSVLALVSLRRRLPQTGRPVDVEEVTEEQQQYAVPNGELRDALRTELASRIVTIFRRFDDTYRNSGFSVKNPGKYLRHTADAVEAKLHSIFSSS